MSFSPLPKTLIADLTASTAGPVVDLGCGDGRFGDRLRRHAPGVLGLDRSRLPHVRADVVADLTALPLAPGSCGVLVAANLLRHLPHPRRAVTAWRRALHPSGRLWILEDEPTRGEGPGALYRELQVWLAHWGPNGRGPLLPRARAQALLAGGGGWRWGRFENREPLRDPESLRSVLGAAAAGGDTTAAKLAARLDTEAFHYGAAWWARWSAEEAS